MLPKIPYSWDRIHGPLWVYIVKLSLPKAHLSLWMGPVLAITSFCFIGTTRNAKRFYQHCVEWIYDHSPKRLQKKLVFMRTTSELCKERRAAMGSYCGRGERNISMVVGYVTLAAFF
jgi:hypothetical protein